MNKTTIGALCTILAFGACGPEAGSNDPADSVTDGPEAAAVNEQEILGLSPSSNVSALFDRHLQNLGAANTCAYRNGKYLNTQTCDSSTTGNQILSIYRVKANNRYMLCNQPSLQRYTGTEACTKNYYSASGSFLNSKWEACNLSQNWGSCVTTGSGTDVRFGEVVIDQNYDEYCYSNSYGQTCFKEQNFYDGKLRWPAPIAKATFAFESDKYLKTNNGSYLKREATQIVTAKSPLSTTDANFQWTIK